MHYTLTTLRAHDCIASTRVVGGSRPRGGSNMGCSGARSFGYVASGKEMYKSGADGKK
jgi:hypothetical protein